MSMKRISLVAALVLSLVSLAAAASPDRTAAATGSTIAAKWIAAWNSHDPDKMLAVFTDDVFYEDVAYGEVSHNHAELRKFAADEFDAVPDLELKLVRASINNGHGTIEWSFSGTDKGIYKTGKRFTVRGVSVIDVHNGKIARSLDFYDSGTIMRQLGVLPAQ